MNIEEIRTYCLSKEKVTESFPFDQNTLVFKVNGKIFALLSLDHPGLNLKCDPELAIELRELFPFVKPGYHMNKKHWNTVIPNADLHPEDLKKWIDHSYELVRKKTK